MIDFEDYERIIAYKSMTDASYLNSIADYVKPEYFENQNIAEYFKIIADFNEKRNKLPTLTEIRSYLTTDALKNSFKRLIESFKDIDKDLDKDELYENTERFLKERATWLEIVEVAENAKAKTKNPQEVLDAFEEICKINLYCEKGLEIYRDINLIIDDILNVESHISSGWKWLDDALDGGFIENGKALYMFAGQANIGKSIFLGNVAGNIANQGKSVLVISLEMSEMVYAKRICSNVSKIPMKDFKFETSTLKGKIQDEELRNPQGKIFIKEFPPSTVTPKQLGAFIKKLIDSGETIDAVVIDYLSLLTTTFGSNSYERIKHICEQIRALSYIFKCPFISAVQLNRCLEISTLVELYNGKLIPIGDIQVGDKLRGSSSKVEVRYVYPREIKGTYKIKTKTGREIICSGEHNFPSSTGLKSIYGGLIVGDSLFTAIQ